MPTSQLIPIYEKHLEGSPVRVVDARELHYELKAKSNFTTWANRRIKKYGFQEGLDFFPFLEESSGGRREKNFHFTVDMAKEFAMIENSEAGRMVRLYFIETEKKYHTQFREPINQIEAIEGALKLLKKQQTKIQDLTKKLQEVTIRLNKQAQSCERDDILRQNMQFQIQNVEHLVHREKFMYTIPAYSNIIGQRLTKEEAQEKGYEARNKSDELGYLTDKVYHPLYGPVNSYHLTVLNKVFHGN